VDRVLFRRTRAIGVSLITATGPTAVYGDQIILSAGVFGTPSILMRSGIGEASSLHEHGIAVLVDLPGVGRDLADHSQVPISGLPRPGVTDIHIPCAQAVLRYSAVGSPLSNDMQLCVLNHVKVRSYAPHLLPGVVGEHAFAVTSNLMFPRSTGRVVLASSDPWRLPRVDLDYCADHEDVRRHREGLRLGWDALNSKWFTKHWWRLLELDDETVRSDSALNKYISYHVQTAHHPTGTAKMGVDNDSETVVDPLCRVRGTTGLRVADASIVPTSVRANTNLTCIMIGEFLAERLLQES
jgi:choline dehydrogenase